MGLEGGIQAWIFSLNPRNEWMDNLRFYGFFLILLQSYQDDGKKINIKLCAMEPHVLHVPSEGKVASMCVLGVGEWGWKADTKALTSNK